MIRKYRRINSRPAVGGDVLGSKFDLQKALAWKKKIGSTQSHLEWPPCRVVWSVSQLLYLLQRAGHFKFFSPSFFVGLELSLWALGMRTGAMLAIAEQMDRCGFQSMEFFGFA